MPAYTRGKKRGDIKYVKVTTNMFFGFKPKDISSIAGVTEGDIAALGHIAPGSVPPAAILVLGANAPKPPRVSRRIKTATVGQQQTVGTFCGFDKMADAQEKGWNIVKYRKGVMLRAVNASRGSQTAIAELSDGSLYCFPMNKADFELFGAELGLKSSATVQSETEKSKLVSGSSTPYPGKASKLLEDGSTFSSFFSTSKGSETAFNGAYDVISEEKIVRRESAGEGE